MRNAGCLFFMLLCQFASAQTVEIIYDEVRATSYEGKSYLVVKSFTIKPPNGGQFRVSGATNGPFYIRAQDLTKVIPSPDKNFVRVESILQKNVLDENQINSLPADQVAVNFKYIDGMGREMEDVNVRASPGGRDVITATYFDNMGYNTKQYLSYTHEQSNGGFRESYETEAKEFYDAPSAGVSREPSRPFSERVYESSSLGKTTDLYGAGNEWFTASRRKQTRTWVDASGIQKKWIFVSNDIAPVLSTYDSLLVTENIDEENHVTREYVNKRGQIVLKQQQLTGDYLTNPSTVTWSETHYCFDDLGRLRFVIPPEATARVTTEYGANETDKRNFLSRWCFKFQYDEMYNQTARWFPGWSDWEYIIYDRWNREVLRQNPAQRARNEWLFKKYDRLNRVIVTGLYTSASTWLELQNSVNMFYTTNADPEDRYETNLSNSIGYSLGNTFPANPPESSLLSVTYYDNYSFRDQPGWDSEGSGSDYQFVNLAGFPQFNGTASLSEIAHNIKGQVAGSKIRVLGSNRWLNNVFYYDKKYRKIQSITENHKNGRDRITSQYDFVGRILKTEAYHTSSVINVSTLREFAYDHAGRQLSLHQTTNGGPRVLLALNKYNELGQLIEKNIHSTDNGLSFLQSIDYRYNIRGWITSVNNSSLSNDGVLNDDADDLFGMQLHYNDAPSAITREGTSTYTPPPLFDGSITAVKWKTDTRENAPGYTPKEKIYGFKYDLLKRLTESWYATYNNGIWNGDVGMFNESVIDNEGERYDRNGNIKGIQRYGMVADSKTLIDDTEYTYDYSGISPMDFQGSSNRLRSVEDSGNDDIGFKDKAAQLDEEFLYDPSGNLIFDQNKEISTVTYNHLNLPESIAFTRQSGQVERIVYLYDAGGNKLSKQVFQNGTSTSNGTEVWRTDYVGEVQYDNEQLSFVNTPEGRAVKNGSNFEYEYFYRDHQNNVRLTYGKLKETISYRATMEEPTASYGDKEEGIFENIAETRYTDTPGTTFNVTKSSNVTPVPNRSSRTNGTESTNVIGPAIHLSLASGDKVKIEVFAKYTQPPGSSATITDAVLIAAATGVFGITAGGEYPQLYSGFNENVPILPNAGSGSSTLPQAYLAYLFFSDSYSFVTSGAIAISTSAYNAFEKLERQFTAPQNGHIYIYVANETNVSSVNVHFDEMLIVHQKNNNALQVTQASDYYPFGLAFNTYQAERISENFTSIQKNRYGFQGQEHQKDLDLGWNQFKWRMSDPSIGRFTGVDPLSDKYLYNSTYAFSENKVTAHVELEGLESASSIWNKQVWTSAGFSYKPGPEQTREIGANLLKEWIMANLTVMSMAAPVEELAVFSAIRLGQRMPAILRSVGFSDEISRIASLPKTLSKVKDSYKVISTGSEITDEGISAISQHLEKFPDGRIENDIMIGRLTKIKAGEMKATDIDINFYNHESRELELVGQNLPYEEAHAITLKEQGMYHRGYEKKLYTEEALKASYDNEMKMLNMNLKTTTNTNH